MKKSSKNKPMQQGAIQYFHHEQVFHFESGGQIPRVDIAYETWGKLNRKRSNALLILTGLSPNALAASSKIVATDGWGVPMIGAGEAVG